MKYIHYLSDWLSNIIGVESEFIYLILSTIIAILIIKIIKNIVNKFIKNVDDERKEFEFNQKFKEFVKRDFLDLRKASEAKFAKFVGRHSIIMVKPVDQSGGADVAKIVIDSKTNVEKLYEVLKNTKQYLVEDYVIDP